MKRRQDSKWRVTVIVASIDVPSLAINTDQSFLAFSKEKKKRNEERENERGTQAGRQIGRMSKGKGNLKSE